MVDLSLPQPHRPPLLKSSRPDFRSVATSSRWPAISRAGWARCYDLDEAERLAKKIADLQEAVRRAIGRGRSYAGVCCA